MPTSFAFKVGDSFTRRNRSYDVTRTILSVEGLYITYQVSYSPPNKPVPPPQRASLDSFADWANRADKA